MIWNTSAVNTAFKNSKSNNNNASSNKRPSNIYNNVVNNQNISACIEEWNILQKTRLKGIDANEVAQGSIDTDRKASNLTHLHHTRHFSRLCLVEWTFKDMVWKLTWSPCFIEMVTV